MTGVNLVPIQSNTVDGPVDGPLNVPTGQIVFPATQNASAGAITLVGTGAVGTITGLPFVIGSASSAHVGYFSGSYTV